MYYVYFDKVLFPIAPSKIQTKIKGNNKTISLINEGEVNQIKTAKLTEFTFELLLPNQKYPFALYKDGYREPLYYLKKLEKFKKDTNGFKFKVLRYEPNGFRAKWNGTTYKILNLFDTSMTVSLEDYTITEDAKDGLDITVSVTLKQYKKYGVTKIKKKKISSDKLTVVKKSSGTKKKTITAYTVKKGDTLPLISKKTIGTASEWRALYKANKSVIEKAAKKNGKKSSANGKYLYAGTKLTIPTSFTGTLQGVGEING